jgi:hypothetical protein
MPSMALLPLDFKLPPSNWLVEESQNSLDLFRGVAGKPAFFVQSTRCHQLTSGIA